MKYSEDKIIEMVKTTQNLSGLTVSEETERVAREIIRGNTTAKEAIDKIKEKYKLNKNNK